MNQLNQQFQRLGTFLVAARVKSSTPHVYEVAASREGEIVALAWSNDSASVWNVRSREFVSTFSIAYQFGGSRIAISRDGDVCVTAEYEGAGVTAYRTDDGAQLWRRNDLNQIQHLQFLSDDQQLFCGMDEASALWLDRSTGRTQGVLGNVSNAWDGPFDDVFLIETAFREAIELWTATGDVLASLRSGDAILDADFAPAAVCYSLSGGGVHCHDLSNGEERWRYTPPLNHHVLRIGCCPAANVVFGVEWCYKTGGPMTLIRLDIQTGEKSTIAELSKERDVTFCLGGSHLLDSNGSIWDTATGRQIQSLPILDRF